MSDDGDYDVGYKKPPKHTQFKKGQSGRQFPRKDQLRAKSKVPRTRDEVVREIAARKIKVRDGDSIREARISELAIERALIRPLSGGTARQLEYAISLLEQAEAFGDRDMTEDELVQDFAVHATPSEVRRVSELAEEFGRYVDKTGPPPGTEEDPDADKP